MCPDCSGGRTNHDPSCRVLAELKRIYAEDAEWFRDNLDQLDYHRRVNWAEAIVHPDVTHVHLVKLSDHAPITRYYYSMNWGTP